MASAHFLFLVLPDWLGEPLCFVPKIPIDGVCTEPDISVFSLKPTR